MSQQEVAIIVGVGPGLGSALGRRFAAAGMAVAIASRDSEKIKALATAIGPNTHPYTCDVTDEAAVERLFRDVESSLGAPTVVIHNAAGYLIKSILESTKEGFEDCWRTVCLGGFFVGRAAARSMTPRGSGTIMFTGATASIRGSALYGNFASAKFGLRALAQSMARELQPKGVHVAHVILDSAIDSEFLRGLLPDRGPERFLNTDDISEAYFRIHEQRKGAWTHELDMRPYGEPF
jgi:NAD(P)-dependent dehydrogenase (short-subunit alcohol dehydrogenase family)